MKLRSVGASVAALLGSLIAFCPRAALAQSLDQQFAQGFELNPIEPAPAGDRFFLVSGGFSDPDAPKGKPPIRAMLFSHYSLAPSLTRTDNATGDQADVVQHQLYVHADFSAYVTKWLMLNADLPLAALQQGEGAAAPSTALGDLRLGARFGLFGKRTTAFAFAPGVDVWLPTGSPKNLTGDKTLRGEPYLGVGGKASVFVYAARFGVQFRAPVNSGSLEVGTSMTYGVAAGVSLFRDILQIGPEISGRSLLDSKNGNAFAPEASPLTGMLGAKVQVVDFTIGAGYGLGLTEAPGNAPRVFFSLAYNPITREAKKAKSKAPPPQAQASDDFQEDPAASEPAPSAPPVDADSDGDGIVDSVDACPDLMGDPSSVVGEHGCPRKIVAEPLPEQEKPRPAPVLAPTPDSDLDGDGIGDTEDSCPREKGVAQPDNAARNGCPEPSTPKAAPAKAAQAAPAATGVTAAVAADGPPTATWVGFRETSPTSALIYVNLSRAVQVTSKTEGQRVTFTLTGTSVKIRNNQNPLLAEHFGSVVEDARLVPKGKDLQLIVTLKKSASVNSRVVKEADGAVLRVEFEQQAAPAAAPPSN